VDLTGDGRSDWIVSIIVFPKLQRTHNITVG
jgi:hypothetical protein